MLELLSLLSRSKIKLTKLDYIILIVLKLIIVVSYIPQR